MDPEPDLYFNIIHLLVLNASPGALIFSVLMVFLLLLCSAMVSGSEIAFFSLDANDLKGLEEDNNKSSSNILKLRDKPKKLLATILISNNFINIAIVLISDFILRTILPDAITMNWSYGSIDKLPFLSSLFSAETLSRIYQFLITIGAVTFLLVLFGEVAPKVYARFNNVSLAKRMARPLLILQSVFKPLSNLLISGTDAIEHRAARHSENGSLTSKEDLEQAIELTVQSDDDQEMDILKSIVKFGDVSVKQIMRSRVDVISVDFRITFTELLKIIRECGYSRIPVYEDDFDTVTGMLYVKDLIPHINETNFEWQQLIRPNVLYTPETKKINDLLQEFKSQHMHMAIVVDEYGGSSGIVTLEDIMEEVIGEIKDEKDDLREIDFIQIDKLNFIFEGKTLLHDICRVMDIDTNTFDEIKGDADTVAGMVIEFMGVLPKENSEINYEGFKFKIIEVDKRRIKRIKVKLPAEIRA